MKKNLLRRLKKNYFLVFLLLLFDVSLYSQNPITVHGRVIDDTMKEPLIGLTVHEKGTTNGTLTDIDGNYTLNTKTGATLVFTFLGYLPVEVTANKNQINVTMKEDSQMLEDVVVVGYGTQKKVNLTGSVAAIDGSTIAYKSASDVLSAMQGEMPGVAVLRTGGQPGRETAGVRIRGFSSANETSALVLIDGVEGELNLLNPNDIASVSVLKDAAASSIYGARAAAGVILVTTKSGGEGKVHISYNGYFAVNTPGLMPERLPAWEEQKFINDSRVNSGAGIEFNEEQVSWLSNPNFNYRPKNSDGRWDFFQSTNWLAEGTRDHTTQQNHGVSIMGGTKELNYLVSAGFFTKNGILKYGPDKNQRYNFRVKLNSELNKYMSLGINTSYSGQFTEANPYGSEKILERLYRVRGRQPIYNPEEDINFKTNPYNGDLQVNAIDLMRNGGSDIERKEAYMGRAELTIHNIVKGLRFQLNASRQSVYNSREIIKRTLIWYNRLGTTIRFQENNPNSLEKSKYYDYHDNFEALGYYDFKIGKQNFNIMAGSSYEVYRKDQMKGIAKNLNSNDFFSFNAFDSSLATNAELSDLVESWSMMSYFGRINYNYDDRYLFEANIRYDGSSRLAPGNRWKAFPSFSVGWRINEEDWFNVEKIDNLKFRASWGQLGIGGILGFYDYLPLLKDGSLMGSKYYYQERLAAKDKAWEVVSTTNLGIDIDVLSSRLSFTGDYYWKTNNDMLIEYNLPNLVGVKSPFGNIGRLKTWGWEFQVNWRDKVGEVKYQLGFNLSDSQNKLVKLSGTNTISAGSKDKLEGYPLNTIWGYQTDGFWSSREEYLAYKEANPGYKSFNDANVSGGDIKYVAQGKADHTISAGGGTPEDPGDLVYMGNSNGRYLYGMNIALQWRNFDFSMLWQGVGKRKIVINTSTIAPFQSTANMPWTIHRDYWTEDNQDAFWPRLYSGNAFNYEPSDKWVQNAAYIRLKNVQFGYNLPIKKKIADRARLYISGDDVWEHSDLLSVFDPEVKDKAEANYYPFFRTWSVGINITF
ncbi:TonB-linked SusC/RagA family outer membrane protein [Dysgonomonas alginatilytica]|uniref:TonB-linked SusC/RagA family outer membrane protein n=1 Tax=Dysgonomonas alginatilytica TaxID=1605892 RepID=A0A2V3PN20_9BACT|nr:TonB-dependent receptor [Dysgonomonas alginatilytica]PXV63039.1 TonB-linked SusC/RagA family outer membrane protein [Dysgonomonas alginatilytica]